MAQKYLNMYKRMHFSKGFVLITIQKIQKQQQKARFHFKLYLKKKKAQ